MNLVLFTLVIKVIQCIGLPNLPNGVLIVPGIAGSGLYGTINNAMIPECDKDNPINLLRTRLWAAILQGLPPASRQRCWAAKLKLMWGITSDEIEPKYYEPENITVTVDQGIHGFDYLDYVKNIGVFGTKYFHDIIHLLRDAGYVDNDTLLGFPFDWRYPPWQIDLSIIKNLIEDFVYRYPDKKVVIISHSLGALAVEMFLTTLVDNDWKKKHIESFISIAGAYGGAHKSIRALLSGYTELTIVDFLGFIDISLIPSDIVRSTQRTFGSILREKFSSNSSYDLTDWWKLLPDEHQLQATHAQDKISSIMLDDPGVPVYCFWSRFDNPTTERSYTYFTDNVEETIPQIDLGYGDNTLLVESASYCKNWESTVMTREFKNMDHVGILMNKDFNLFLSSLITGLPLSYSNEEVLLEI